MVKINDSVENAPFKLKIKMASDFKWTAISDEMVDNMLRINAPALLLGYLRPIIANITNSSGFPAYNIQFVDFSSVKEEG